MNEPARKTTLTLSLLAVIAVIYSWPLFVHPDYWGIQDWDMFLLKTGVGRDSILRYGQFPLWNPYQNGGVPHWAHPESTTLSLAFVMDLLFGVVRAAKINVTLHLFIGLAGAFSLARHYGLRRVAALLAACLFMLNSMYAELITGGMEWAYQIALMPWAFLFFLKSHETFPAVIATSVMLTLMWLGAGVYPFLISLLFYATYTAVAVLSREYPLKRSLLVLAAIMGLTFALGAVKFIPSIELTSQYTRHTEIYSGLSVEALLHGLFGRDQTISAIEGKSAEEGFLYGYSHSMDEVGMYVGVLPVLLCLIGLGCRCKRHRSLALCMLIFLWLCLGFRSEPLSLWSLVHKVPPYNVMRTAERFRFIVMLGLALFAGAGLEEGWQWLSRRWQERRATLFSYGVLLLIVADLVYVNAPVFQDAFPIPPLELPERGAFMQISGWPNYDENGPETPSSNQLHLTYGAGFPAFLTNRGTLLSYESMPLPANALPISAPEYRGEVFLEGTTGSASYALWSPNRLVVDLHASGPGDLIINQNYFQGWHLQGGGELKSVRGLLAVAVTPDIKRVELYYRPLSVVVGTVVSSATLLGLMAWWLLASRKNAAARRLAG